jgi:hypothetical protein
MHLSGETEIAAGRQRVWDTISNPNRAAASNSSGQAQIEKIDDRHYKVTVSAPAAMMPMNVVLDLQLTDSTRRRDRRDDRGRDHGRPDQRHGLDRSGRARPEADPPDLGRRRHARRLLGGFDRWSRDRCSTPQTRASRRSRSGSRPRKPRPGRNRARLGWPVGGLYFWRV